MTQKIHIKTVIIGGGVAGLMCANELIKKGYSDFLLITKDLGGRVVTSQDSKVNYGAYFVTKEYKHLKKYLRIGRQMKKSSFGFVQKGKISSLISFFTATHIFTFIKLYIALWHFRRRFNTFRKRCLRMSQKEALEKDPYLLRLYHVSGSEVIHDMKALSLTRHYFDQLGNFMSFAYPGKTNAFSLMQWASEMLMYKMYEFYLDTDALCDSFKDKIVHAEVAQISKDGDVHVVKTKGAQYRAENLVLATEPWVTRKLLHLHSKAAQLTTSYVRHIKGTPRRVVSVSPFTYIMFPAKSGMISIGKQKDGSYLIYTDSKDVPIESYFSRHKVIDERTWDPAFVFSSNELLEAHRGKGLFLIGGSNIEGMEDCAITGIWAARQIVHGQ